MEQTPVSRVPDKSSEAPARIVPKHFPSLDGLRGVAVIAVFLFHYGAGAASSNPLLHALGSFVKVGWAGVTLFFLLSGFLITGILWESRGQEHWWRNFYLRRVFRIFPLYYGSLILILLAALVSGYFRTTAHLIWIPALFLQDIPSLSLQANQIYPLDIFHYWSLAVEEQFYLLWPLLLFFMKNRKQAAWLCLVVFVLSLVFRAFIVVFMPDATSSYSTFPLSRAGELALGGWLAMMYRSSYWDKLQRVLPLTGLISGVAVLAVAWQHHGFELEGPWQMTVGLCAVTIFLAAILGRSLQPGILQRLASIAWLQWVGKISFGIYVFHLLFVRVYTAIAWYLVGAGSQATFAGVRWLIAAAGTVGMAWLSYNRFEKPFQKMKKRFPARTV